jgi:phenylacetic acid degradation operon negative regulatory protein
VRTAVLPRTALSIKKVFCCTCHKDCCPIDRPAGDYFSVKPKTEEFLNSLLWTAEMLTRPTFRNLTESYESWAYRNGFFNQIAKLEKQKLLERDPKFKNDRLYRLTEQGRLHALGGRDPQVQWSRYWDGRWRLVLFDVPMGQNARRERLRRYLRSRTFGCLQGSVWITPDPVHTEREILAEGEINVASLLLLEARPCAGESDAEIVAGAWDLERINQRFIRHLKVLDQYPSGPLRDAASAKTLQRWAAEEREAWLAAITIDPLLPECLLPPSYLGRRAWRHRRKVLARAGQRLQAFKA